MSGYKIGKDVGELYARVKMLERSSGCGCDKGGRATDAAQRGVGDAALLESLKNAAPNEKVFSILKNLVTHAGDITIRDLFAATSDDVSPAAVEALTDAKAIGFLALSNDKCCHEVDDPTEDDYCKTQKGKWCSLVKASIKWRCTLASDKC